MFDGFGAFVWALLYVAIFGVVAAAALIGGAVLSLIGVTVNIGGLALVATFVGLATCVLVGTVYRP